MKNIRIVITVASALLVFHPNISRAQNKQGVVLSCVGDMTVSVQGSTNKIPGKIRAIVRINIAGKSACIHTEIEDLLTGKKTPYPKSCRKAEISDDSFLVLSERVENKADHVAYKSNVLIDRYHGSMSYSTDQHFFGGSYIRRYEANLSCKKTSEFEVKKQF